MTKAARKTFKPGSGYTKAAWDAVSENPEWTADRMAEARPFSDVFPELAEAVKRARGRPRVKAPKQAVTLRLDPSTLAKFRATGKDWRTRMVEVLDKAKP
jgi:uncharacterized protein (DUF4415 family)